MNSLYIQFDEDKSASVGWAFNTTRMMKLTLFLICLSASAAFATASDAQNSALTLKVTNEPIVHVLEKIDPRRPARVEHKAHTIL